MKNDNFGIMVDYLSTFSKDPITVPKDKYDDWQKQWVFDAISGMRYGESFCKFFNISNASPLYFFRDNNICERWINDNYIEK